MSIEKPLMHAITDSTVTRHRISVDDYYRMGEVGILRQDTRLELIEGDIIDMAPIGSVHAGTVKRLAKLFMNTVGNSSIVSVQDPVRLDAYSEPQPDIALLRPREDYYRDAHPQSGDVLLIVEVAETSLAYDQGTKVPLYARHGIPEVWVLDVRSNQLHIYRQPEQDSYEVIETLVQAAIIAPTRLPKVAINLAGLL